MGAYFDQFFREKDLPYQMWEIEGPDGNVHIIDSEKVIAEISTAPAHEREGIKKMLIRLDFLNADIMDYLYHLAKGYVAAYCREKAKNPFGKLITVEKPE